MNSGVWNVIKIIAVVLFLISVLINAHMYFSRGQKISIIKSGTLETYELISWDTNQNGYWINIRNVETNKVVPNAFVSRSCPGFSNRARQGSRMLLVEKTLMNLSTHETTQQAYRSYYYLCTNSNMQQRDAELLRRIEQARNNAIKASQTN